MVEAGMPPLEIQSATITNAMLLGIGDEVGQIKENFADIIAVDENPLTTIRTLEKVCFVMKEGKIYPKPVYTIFQ
jgi:imidazolonepropionase-like amidohydrolase